MDVTQKTKGVGTLRALGLARSAYRGTLLGLNKNDTDEIRRPGLPRRLLPVAQWRRHWPSVTAGPVGIDDKRMWGLNKMEQNGHWRNLTDMDINGTNKEGRDELR